MLYLISQKGSRTFKIGYTSNIRNRFRTYRTCMGSSFEVIATMEGTKTDEKDWHFFMEYLKFIKVEDAKEWYKIPRGITKDEIRKTGFNFFARYQKNLIPFFVIRPLGPKYYITLLYKKSIHFLKIFLFSLFS